MAIDEKPWWQQGSPKAFRERIAKTPIQELEILAGEIAGSLAVIQAQIQASDRDEEWRKRAIIAQGFIAERKSILRAEITRRHESSRRRKDEEKRRLIAQAREKIANGDLAAAMLMVLDLMEGAHAKVTNES